METQIGSWESSNEFADWEKEQEEIARGRDLEDSFLNDSGWNWETGRFEQGV